MNKLFHLPLLVLGMLLGSIGAVAQDDTPVSPERLKEIKAQRSAYITTKLGLTAAEAQEFWPIYNAFDEEREQLRSERRANHRTKGDDTATMTEKEAAELLAKRDSDRQQELDLERTYSERFVKSIGAVKTLELHKAESDFRREVLRNFKERMGDRRREGQGPPPRR